MGYSVYNLLSLRLLSKRMRIRKCTATISPLVLCRGKTWSLTSNEEPIVQVFYDTVCEDGIRSYAVGTNRRQEKITQTGYL
jgi:hypothetical protein